jgi:acrylyl-CoA reductase (NADPH)
MTAGSFKALVVSQGPDGSFHREVCRRNIADLAPGELLVRVAYSSLNYKDALAAAGRRGVARGYPLTPGIDAAGTVEHSNVQKGAPREGGAASFVAGDRVLVTGHELGTGLPGGLGQFISVPASWALHLPPGLSLRESMIIGTAGFTAALSVRALREHGVQPESGEVLVTGATGGVGSFSVAILARLGYTLVACTGKTDKGGFLQSLGAREVLRREQLADTSGKALLKERWAGVVDTVGGDILSAAIRSTAYGGCVAACGNAAGSELPLTVFPFILRGVRLLGIESARCPEETRRDAWSRLGAQWKPARLETMATECRLEDVSSRMDDILQGRLTGRVVVNLEAS